MADDTQYVTTPEDMEAFDKLPRRLQRFLDTAVLGLPATPVLELYEKKLKDKQEMDALFEGGSGDDPVGDTIKALTQYMKNAGVRDFRPLVRRSRNARS